MTRPRETPARETRSLTNTLHCWAAEAVPGRSLDGLLHDMTSPQPAQEILSRRVRELTAALAHAPGALQAMRDLAKRHGRERPHQMTYQWCTRMTP